MRLSLGGRTWSISPHAESRSAGPALASINSHNRYLVLGESHEMIQVFRAVPADQLLRTL